MLSDYSFTQTVDESSKNAQLFEQTEPKGELNANPVVKIANTQRMNRFLRTLQEGENMESCTSTISSGRSSSSSDTENTSSYSSHSSTKRSRMNGRKCTAHREVYKHLHSFEAFQKYIQTQQQEKVFFGNREFYKNYKDVFVLSQNKHGNQYVRAVPKNEIKKQKNWFLRRQARLLTEQMEGRNRKFFMRVVNEPKRREFSLNRAKREAHRKQTDQNQPAIITGETYWPTEKAFKGYCRKGTSVMARDIWVKGETHRLLVNQRMKPFIGLTNGRVKCIQPYDLYKPKALKAAKHLYKRFKNVGVAPLTPKEQYLREQSQPEYTNPVKKRIKFWEQFQEEAAVSHNW